MARCGCSGSVCNCVILSSDTVLVEGSGTPGNPYVLTAESGGGGGTFIVEGTGITITGTGTLVDPYVISADGGSTCVTTTIAALTALQTAGTLDTCATYIVTDWTTPNALPGPNFLFARAVAANKISEDIGVYATVNATDVAVGLYTGPVRGKYFWAGAVTGMYYLESSTQNKITDLIALGGAGGTIDSWVWNKLQFRENEINSVTFTGGYATMSALAVSGVTTFEQCRIDKGTLNLTGLTTSVQFINTDMVEPVFVLAGPTSRFQDCDFGRGARITTTGKTAGSLIMSSCRTAQDGAAFTGTTITYDGDGTLTMAAIDMLGSNIEIHSDATMNWYNSSLDGNSVVVAAAAARGLNLVDVHLVAGTIAQLRSGGAANVDTVRYSTITGAVNLSGAVDPGTDQVLDGVRLFLGQLNVTDPVATGTPVSSIHIDSGTLNVNAGGSASVIRIFGGATLNTGAFAHQDVDLSGSFTVTLTAANVDTYRGFGSSTLI